MASSMVLVQESQAQTARPVFPLYVKVDSNYGDNTEAAASNPSASQLLSTTLVNNTATLPSTGVGELIHAPYSFRTVTAAVAWINATMPLTSWVNGLYTPPTSTKSIKWVIIEVLPGLYGPKSPSAIDADSGLPWNGETFPIKLPPFVSVQGTSALDTIIDARRGTTSVFTVGSQDQGWNGFIDSLTIRGARGIYNPLDPQQTLGNRPGAGVFIEGLGAPGNIGNVGGFISNCFFTDNTVGVAMISEVILNGEEPPVVVVKTRHRTSIVGNTFAYNEIGVYSGSTIMTEKSLFAQQNGLPPDVYGGWSVPALINNILESTTPAEEVARGIKIGAIAFEGIAWDAMRVSGVFDSSTGHLLNPNAWDRPGGVDFRHSGNDPFNPTHSWPVTQFTQTGKPQDPRIELSLFTGAPAANGAATVVGRGTLYISDAFRRDATTHGAGGVPRSRHDFRLSPQAQLFNATYSANTLISAGLNPPDPRTGTPLTMVNNTVVMTHLEPYVDASSTVWHPEDIASVSSSDYDCDGYGNPRIGRKGFDLYVVNARPANWFYANNPQINPILNASIDLGADEAGQLIVSGYLDNSRIFSRSHAWVDSLLGSGAALPGRVSLFFFDFHDPVAAGSARPYVRPFYNQAIDWAPDQFLGGMGNIFQDIPKRQDVGANPMLTSWYQQLHNNPYRRLGSVSNYTDGGRATVTAESRVDFVAANYGAGANGCPEFMRNLHCDIGPGLSLERPSSSRPWYYYEMPLSLLQGAPPVMKAFSGSPYWGRVAGMTGSIFSGENEDWFISNPWFDAVQMAVSNHPYGWTNMHLRYSDSALIDGGRHAISMPAPPLTCPSGMFPDAAWHTTRLYNHWDSAAPSVEWSKYTWDYNSLSSGLYTVKVNGIGDSSIVDTVPGIPANSWHGARYNLEPKYPGHIDWVSNLGNPTSNIQTLLVIQDELGGTGAATSQMRGSGSNTNSFTSRPAKVIMREFRNFAKVHGYQQKPRK